MRPKLSAAALPLVLTACNVVNTRPGTAPPAATAPPPATRQVIEALKADLADYLAYQRYVETEPPLENACKGQLNFRIRSIDVKLTTQTERKTDGTVATEVPFAGVKLGPKVAGSAGEKSTQDLFFSIEFRPDTARGPRAAPPTPRAGTFYAALRSTREAMLAASGREPCVTFTAEQSNGITAAFEVTSEQHAELGFGFLIFSAEAGRTVDRTAANTVTVNFDVNGGVMLDRQGRRIAVPTRGWMSEGGFFIPDDLLKPPAADRTPAAPPPKR